MKKYLRISSVGIGSTNSMNVERGYMGTSPAAHLVGAAFTAFLEIIESKKEKYTLKMLHIHLAHLTEEYSTD